MAQLLSTISDAGPYLYVPIPLPPNPTDEYIKALRELAEEIACEGDIKTAEYRTIPDPHIFIMSMYANGHVHTSKILARLGNFFRKQP